MTKTGTSLSLSELFCDVIIHILIILSLSIYYSFSRYYQFISILIFYLFIAFCLDFSLSLPLSFLTFPSLSLILLYLLPHILDIFLAFIIMFGCLFFFSSFCLLSSVEYLILLTSIDSLYLLGYFPVFVFLAANSFIRSLHRFLKRKRKEKKNNE